MPELERKLEQLGAELEYPPTPPLTAAVGRRLQIGPRASARRRWRPLTARAALLATALLLLLAGGVVAAVPAARHAVLDLVGLRGATVERVPELPAGARIRLGAVLGWPTSLEGALPGLSFGPLLPEDLGEPNGVFGPAADAPPGGEISFTYPPRPGLPRSRYTGVGLLINEIDGSFAPGFFYKMAPRGVPIERLRVDGDEAVWVEGLHEFFYKDGATHTFYRGRARLAGNTLLVQVGSVMVRIEGELDLPRAMAMARSLRPAP
jgi:hypothetical protein